MKQIGFLCAAMVVAVAGMAQNSSLAYPESIISDGQFLYVSNIGKAMDPSGKDGDGFISKCSLNGKIITRNISQEVLHAPKGSGIIKGVLYVADVDRLVGIALNTGKKVMEVALPTQFANDVAVKDDHTVFVSATDVGKVFEVDVEAMTVKVVAEVKGVNGLVYAGKRLYTNSFLFEDMKGGEVGVVADGVHKRIGDIKGAFDGMALINDHTLIVSDWGALDKAAGFFLKIDLRTQKATRLNLPLIAGPADFFYKDKVLYVPALVEQKIVIRRL